MLTSKEIKEIARLTAIEMEKRTDEVLNLAVTAVMLGKSPEAVKQMCRRNKLPFRKHQKSYFFSKNEITKYLLQCGQD